MRTILVVLTVALFASLASAGERGDDTPKRQSLIYLSALQVIAKGDELDGKRIRISGWLRIWGKEPFLFPTPDHMKVLDLPSAIQISWDSLVKADMNVDKKKWVNKANGNYCVVEGDYAKWKPLPGAIGCGTMDTVYSLEIPYLKPKEPEVRNPKRKER